MRSWQRATWPWRSLRTVAWWTPPSRKIFHLMGSLWHQPAGTGASGRFSPWGTSSNRQRRRPHRFRERYDAFINMNKTWPDMGQTFQSDMLKSSVHYCKEKTENLTSVSSSVTVWRWSCRSCRYCMTAVRGREQSWRRSCSAARQSWRSCQGGLRWGTDMNNIVVYSWNKKQGNWFKYYPTG